MTDYQHPITPPPELVEQWIKDANHNESMFAQVAIMGAHWGSDQELEACCDWFLLEGWHPDHPNKLRAARRPKPPSLKDEALKALRSIERGQDRPEDTETIRRALEALPE
jgi:hypothetical protein